MSKSGEVETKEMILGYPMCVRAKEAAKMLGLSAQTLANHRAAGKGAPFIKFGRTILYEINALKSYLYEREVLPRNGR
jgi:hypothetical protein